MADYIRTMNADGIGGVKSWTVCLINMDNGEKFNIADLQDVGGGILRREGTGVDFSETTASIPVSYTHLDVYKRQGHESIDITYNYAHLFPSKQTEMADKLNMERSN